MLLREAFDAARATGGGVRLITARWRPDRSGTTARSDDLDRELALLLERLRSDYPDVPADLRVSSAGAADSLLAASRSASLLVSAPAPVHGARTLGAGAGPVTVG